MRFCLVKPDMPGNFGTIVRTLACFGVFELDVIMPMGFTLDDKDLKRSMMDYGGDFKVNRFDDFLEYREKNIKSRFILATTKSKKGFMEIDYKIDDVILFGSESKGVEGDVLNGCDEKVTIKMKGAARSINLAVSFGIIANYAIYSADL